MKDQCWQEGGGRAGKAPKWFKGKKKEKSSEKAATATTVASATTQSSADAEPDGVWLAQTQDND